jgi:hypothetical protein
MHEPTENTRVSPLPRSYHAQTALLILVLAAGIVWSFAELLLNRPVYSGLVEHGASWRVYLLFAVRWGVIPILWLVALGKLRALGRCVPPPTLSQEPTIEKPRLTPSGK